MDALQLAFLEVALTRAVMRAHMDIEAQVAHWLVEGRARREDLAEARRTLREARRTHARAKAAYAGLLVQSRPPVSSRKGARRGR